MEFSTDKGQIVAAMVKARLAMKTEVRKNKENGGVKGAWYADLEQFLDTIRPALESNGLIVIQSPLPCTEKGQMLVLPLETMILHESGEYMTAVMEMPLSFSRGAAAHNVGSAITYARRYHLSALFGITQSDDDGNATKKSARQWISDLEAIEDLDKLKEAVGKVVHMLADDSASVKVVREWHITRQAQLRAQTAVGFNPASVVRPRKGSDNAEAPAVSEPDKAAETAQGSVEAPATDKKVNLEDF